MEKTITDEQHDTETIVSAFDRICFSFGDEDAIVSDESSTSTSVSYIEIQEHSKNLAFQLHWRLQPDYVLVDCQRHAGAEAVATLSCMRIQCPFVPVSCADQHRPGRLQVVVEHLRANGKQQNYNDEPAVVAITVCDNDLDPILAVFQQADVHQILYLDKNGALQEQIQVPNFLPASLGSIFNDDLMVLFTSGTTGGTPKAVVGSHAATLRRIQWFLNRFDSSSRIVRKTALTFVDGITELWTSLLDHNSILLALHPGSLLGEGLDAILRAKPSQLLLLPSQLGQLLMLPKCESLRRLIISGEQASRVLIERVYLAYPDVQVINLYGQTETSGDVLCAVLTDMDNSVAFQDDLVAVGTPIGDTTVSINNQHEFIIQGSQLSNGYLGQTCTFDSFATGDIGFCRNGIYYVKCRKDDVVKLHGIWTSPSEIETAFCRFYQTQEALACFFKDEAYILCPNEGVCQQFSRTGMHNDSDLPWNLIPNTVICRTIPTSRESGSAKASRREARKIVMELLESNHTASRDRQSSEKDFGPSTSSIVSEVLGLNSDSLDLKKSFVELGGNSAKAIILLFQLRQFFQRASTLTATDLLMEDSLEHLTRLLAGQDTASPRKKQKQLGRSDFTSEEFHPDLPTVHSDNHISVRLLACVDSKPVISQQSIYAACQGGVIIQCTKKGQIQAHRHLKGWMIQSDLMVSQGMLIVCAYKSFADAGLVMALSMDLKNEVWKLEFDLPIKATPLLVDGNVLWVSAGTSEHTCVYTISAITGRLAGHRILLPGPSLSKPVEVDGDIFYGCSSWEGGVLVVEKESHKVHCFLEGEIGPVIGRDLVAAGDKTILIGDAYGVLHCLDVKEKIVIKRWQLGSMPLTTALLDNKQGIFVGSNDGRLYAVIRDKKVWECDCKGSILVRPVWLDQADGSILVCTTAGQLLKISREGELLLRRRHIRGETWGDVEFLNSPTGKDCVTLGARDGRVHIISL